MNQKAAYWVEIAEYDLETARAMLRTERFLYVGFMCHQVVEKMLKACYAHGTDEIPPYVHNLRRLADLSGTYGEMSDDQKGLLDVLEPLNVETRYPADRMSLARALDRPGCEELLSRTEDFYRWIKQRLSNT